MGNYNFELDLNSDNTMSVIDSWIEKETDVLEFGCANGRLTKHLAKNKKCRLTIVEIDLEAGREAALYAECSYLGKEKGDINNFFWLNVEKKFDYIIFADVLEHMPDPQLVLNKCKEVIKNDGEILVSIPNVSHNSIIIDLFNDNFCYSKSGLLDKTHVHFFTHKTFCEMISQLGLKIIKEHSIYSRVGWNEINNSYSDVPYSVERELRNRVKGSIYQYVFSISKQETIYEECSNIILALEDDIIRQEEASCFFWDNLHSIEEANRCGVIYTPHESNVICFPVNNIAEKVRIDIIENSGLIQIENILVKPQNKQEVGVGIIEHNALCQMDNIYYFDVSDPYIFIDMEKVHSIQLEYVKIEFRLLDCRMSDCQKNIYNYIFDKLSDSKAIIVNEEQNKELYKSKEYIYHLENDISQQKEYIIHLENDIKEQADAIKLQKNGKLILEQNISEQKEYIEHLENDIASQKEYVVHLEKDIAEQTASIIHLENDIAGQKEYVVHLEKDIAEQTASIIHLENDIAGQKEYVVHLEKDIAEQTATIIHLQNDIIERKEYIAHLEKDIAEQRDYIVDLEQKARKGIKYIFKRGKK